MNKNSAVILAALFVALAACGNRRERGNGCDEVAKRARTESIAKIPERAPMAAKSQMEEMAGKMADLIRKRCKDDDWSADAITCGKEADDPKECLAKLSSEQRERFMDDAQELSRGVAIRMGAPRRGPRAAGGTNGAGAAPTTGLPECDLYVAAAEKYVSCVGAREGVGDAASAVEAMKAGWGDVSSMSEESRRLADDQCRVAKEALVHNAHAAGCSL